MKGPRPLAAGQKDAFGRGLDCHLLRVKVAPVDDVNPPLHFVAHAPAVVGRRKAFHTCLNENIDVRERCFGRWSTEAKLRDVMLDGLPRMSGEFVRAVERAVQTSLLQGGPEIAKCAELLNVYIVCVRCGRKVEVDGFAAVYCVVDLLDSARNRGRGCAPNSTAEDWPDAGGRPRP